MRPTSFTLSSAEDADGICAAQKPAGAGAMLLNGALASGNAVALTCGTIISITSTGDESGKTFTVVGTDQNGNSLTEVVTGPNNTTVVSTGYFRSIASITVSAATAQNITIGTTDDTSSPWIQVNRYSADGYTLAVDVTGTVEYTVYYTLDNIQTTAAPLWVAITEFSGKTADVLSEVGFAVEAFKCVTTALGGASETVKFTVIHR